MQLNNWGKSGDDGGCVDTDWGVYSGEVGCDGGMALPPIDLQFGASRVKRRGRARFGKALYTKDR